MPGLASESAQRVPARGGRATSGGDGRHRHRASRLHEQLSPSGRRKRRLIAVEESGNEIERNRERRGRRHLAPGLSVFLTNVVPFSGAVRDPRCMIGRDPVPTRVSGVERPPHCRRLAIGHRPRNHIPIAVNSGRHTGSVHHEETGFRSPRCRDSSSGGCDDCAVHEVPHHQRAVRRHEGRRGDGPHPLRRDHQRDRRDPGQPERDLRQ